MTENNAAPNQITFATLREEIMAFFQMEKGALRTTFQMATRPGATIREFLHEDRSRLTNPLRYLAMCTALVTLTMFLFSFGSAPPQFDPENDESIKAALGGELTEEVKQKWRNSLSLLDEITSDTENAFMRLNSRQARKVLVESVGGRAGEIAVSWMNVFLLANLPLFSVMTWLVFRRSQLNVWEHVVVNAYIMGFQNILSLAAFPPSWMGYPMESATVYLCVSGAYQFWVWRSIFNVRGILWNAIALVATLVSIALTFSVQAAATLTVLWFMMR